MARLRGMRPEWFLALFGLALAGLTLGLMITRAPNQLMMAMLVPILLAVVIFPRRLYLFTLPLFVIAYLVLLVWERQLHTNIVGMVTGSLVTFLAIQYLGFK